MRPLSLSWWILSLSWWTCKRFPVSELCRFSSLFINLQPDPLLCQCRSARPEEFKCGEPGRMQQQQH
uniref:Putative secreted peptide n=1 Tax=Anopheles braziliensis TaxID=58242 RepID=A0A2M3ZVF3_9DIPT